MEYTNCFRQDIASNKIIDSKKGDVNGDQIQDDVYITGHKDSTIIINDIGTFVIDGKTKDTHNINLAINKGYNPSLFLGDFTGDRVNDILISIESGNTGLEGYYYIYSFLNNVEHKLFDFMNFNNKYQYDVTYQNNYVVRVMSKYNHHDFVIDIKSKDYVPKIYNADGTLKRPLKGRVSALIKLIPISSDTTLGLEATQRIMGYYDGDVLGTIVTPLRWNGTDFTISRNPYLKGI